MMNLTELKQIKSRSKKRLGRGHGSGRGKTSGRGTKGQLARHNSPLDFDGDANPLIRRLPFLRGKGRNISRQAKAFVVNAGALNVYSDGDTVSIDTLAKHGLVRATEAEAVGVKILAEGELQKKLIVKVTVSKNAVKKIEKAGGKVE